MANPNSPEKMQQIVDSLRADPNVGVVVALTEDYIEAGELIYIRDDDVLSREIEVFACPAKPIYSTDGLNEFMEGLIPELEPTSTQPFEGSFNENFIDFGKQDYEEVIGTVALTGTVHLKRGLSIVRDGVVSPDWTTIRNSKMTQLTTVRLYPDERYLANAATAPEDRQPYTTYGTFTDDGPCDPYRGAMELGESTFSLLRQRPGLIPIKIPEAS